MDPISQFFNDNADYIIGGIGLLTALYGFVIIREAGKFLHKAVENQRTKNKNFGLESIVKRINVNPRDNYFSYINNKNGKIVYH